MNLLFATLALPLLGALLAAGLPSRLDRAARIGGTAFAAASLGTAIALLAGRPSATPVGPGSPIRPWHEVDLAWAPDLSVRFHIGVDGISYPLVVLTALLTLLCCAYSLWRVPEPGRGRLLVALLLVIEVGIVGVFLALDLVLFFVFFELVLLPMYAVIAVWGGEASPASARHAARKFVLYTLFGSVLLLVGIFTVVS